eukprot:486897-Pelagomonas_calceolata.AAC.4
MPPSPSSPPGIPGKLGNAGKGPEILGKLPGIPEEPALMPRRFSRPGRFARSGGRLLRSGTLLPPDRLLRPGKLPSPGRLPIPGMLLNPGMLLRQGRLAGKEPGTNPGKGLLPLLGAFAAVSTLGGLPLPLGALVAAAGAPPPPCKRQTQFQELRVRNKCDALFFACSMSPLPLGAPVAAAGAPCLPAKVRVCVRTCTALHCLEACAHARTHTHT